MMQPAFTLRFLMLGTLVLGLGVVSIARLAFVQLHQSDFLKSQGDKVVLHNESLPMNRGFIFDRNQEVLAASTPVPSIWANPKLLDTQSQGFRELATILNKRLSRLKEEMEKVKERDFIYLKRQVTPDLAAQIEQLNLDAVHIRMEYKRYYPAGKVTAHVVGLTNIDDQGQEGVELSFNEQLSGIQGSKRVLRDNQGRNIADIGYVTWPKIGQDLVLSLDLRLQYIAYRELQKAVKKHKAASGSIVLLDAASGEILALVNEPSYNPNSTQKINFSHVRNRALTDMIEPGSTIKPLVVAAALNSRQYTRDDVIDTNPGFIRVGNKVIRDPANYGVIDLKTLIAKSSQVGIVKLAQSMRMDYVVETMAKFGFDGPTGLELPGESTGRMPDLPTMNETSRAALAYGYGMAVTPLQLARAYTIFANQGEISDLTILKKNAGADKDRRAVIAQETALDLLDFLEAVTERSGTATKAKNHLYSIAGKTGTVRRTKRGGNQGYDKNSHNSLFVGIAPSGAPKIVGVVLIREPKGQVRGGGYIAAPVFSKVAVASLRLLGVVPDQHLASRSAL